MSEDNVFILNNYDIFCFESLALCHGVCEIYCRFLLGRWGLEVHSMAFLPSIEPCAYDDTCS